jgi:hypothetical protein
VVLSTSGLESGQAQAYGQPAMALNKTRALSHQAQSFDV